MNEETEDLITFSEAARLRGRTPQSIDDLVKRKRLNVKVILGKKFVYKKEVENLEIGKSGRPSKLKVQDSQSKFEELVRKHQNPENYYPSLLSEMLQIRRIWKEHKRENPDQLSQDLLAYFTDENFKRNRQKFRQTFHHFERKLQAKLFINQRIIVERVYSNSKIQAFFEYVLSSPDIKTNTFRIEDLFVRFVNEFFNEFRFIIDELKMDSDFKKDLKQVGRPKSRISKRGEIKNLKPKQKNAIKLWNDGKSGQEIINELFPRSNYKKRSLRTKDITNLKNVLRYHAKHNSSLFIRQFDVGAFNRII